MSNFEKAKSYYQNGLWTKAMLRNLVKKGYISEAEYKEIIGDD